MVPDRFPRAKSELFGKQGARAVGTRAAPAPGGHALGFDYGKAQGTSRGAGAPPLLFHLPALLLLLLAQQREIIDDDFRDVPAHALFIFVAAVGELTTQGYLFAFLAIAADRFG
jgi:hypothetical protein